MTDTITLTRDEAKFIKNGLEVGISESAYLVDGGFYIPEPLEASLAILNSKLTTNKE